MIEEKLKKIDEQMAQLKARKQAILNREKQQERKERTHRLIMIGAVIEKYFDIHTIEEAEALGEIATADKQKVDNLKKQIKAKVIEYEANTERIKKEKVEKLKD